MNDEALSTLIEITHQYFDGLHNADVDLLKRIFHPDCVLKAPGIRRDINEWLRLVSNRPVPANEGLPYAYRILNIEVLGQQAMVKVLCPLLGSTFVDFLGLLRENDRWLIVNKMYADIPDYLNVE
ncbi:MAG: nuclear transport factor 2 family protein [Pseudomonadales bacterium]|nr:nuclear transport factor 2 family protein [Pseudomonadales bacterium]